MLLPRTLADEARADPAQAAGLALAPAVRDSRRPARPAARAPRPAVASARARVRRAQAARPAQAVMALGPASSPAEPHRPAARHPPVPAARPTALAADQAAASADLPS